MDGYLVLLIQDLQNKKYRIRWKRWMNPYNDTEYREIVQRFNNDNENYFIAMPYPVLNKSDLLERVRNIADGMEIIGYKSDIRCKCPAYFDDYNEECTLNDDV